MFTTATEATTMTKPPTLTVPTHPDKSKAEMAASLAVSSNFDATLTAHALLAKQEHPFRPDDLGALADELADRSGREVTGTRALLLQALTLDKLFHHLTRVAIGTKYVGDMAEPLKLALRAQAQSRATYQAVSDIRNPRQYVGTQHVGEQYNAAGHQQVNRDAHADARDNPPTELSAHPEGQTDELHPIRSAPAGIEGAGNALEAVGVVDRAANG